MWKKVPRWEGMVEKESVARSLTLPIAAKFHFQMHSDINKQNKTFFKSTGIMWTWDNIFSLLVVQQVPQELEQENRIGIPSCSRNASLGKALVLARATVWWDHAIGFSLTFLCM